MGNSLVIKDLVKNFYAPNGTLTTTINVPWLEIKQEEALVLTGPSGSGKSTLLHMVAGLLAPSQGTISFGDTILTQQNEQQWNAFRASSLGYVFQNFNLLDALTVRENILLAGYILGRRDKEQMEEKAAELLSLVGLEQKRNSYPSSLSLGEKQRIATIRAIFNQPAILLADEPTASLDRKNGTKLLELLQRVCRENKAILIVSSHDEKVMEQFARRFDIGQGGEV